MAEELRDAALNDGLALRVELARLLATPDVAEMSLPRLTLDVYRMVERNSAGQDESWLRERALLAHDSNLARGLKSLATDTPGGPLRLNDDEERELILRVWGTQSGRPQVRADWKLLVAELRGADDLGRMTPAGLHSWFVQHVERTFERAGAGKRR